VTLLRQLMQTWLSWTQSAAAVLADPMPRWGQPWPQAYQYGSSGLCVTDTTTLHELGLLAGQLALKDLTVDQSNPKDLIGIKKVQVGLLPAAGKIYGAKAMENGAAKYGPYNWRDKKVKYTIYLDAMERHLLALRDREDNAADSGYPHLGHIIACAAILADAVEGGFIVDDRPLPGPAAAVLDRFKET